MTTLQIKPLGLRTKKRCGAPKGEKECGEKATVEIVYDHGYGPEGSAFYCAEHSYQEQDNVALDNSNEAAGFILF